MFPHRGILNASICCVRSHCRKSSRCSVEAKGSGRVNVRQRGSPSGWASHRHPAAQYRTNHLICQQRPSSSLLPDPASKRNPRGEVGSWQAYSTCTQTHSLYGYIQYTCWIILSNKEWLRMLCSLKCEMQVQRCWQRWRCSLSAFLLYHSIYIHTLIWQACDF